MICRRCKGATTRIGLCGICAAVINGMTDDQFEAFVDRAIPAPKPQRTKIYGVDNPRQAKRAPVLR